MEEIKIGNQIWSTNLFTKYFNNGDLINYAETNEEWLYASKNKIPSWCYVNYNYTPNRDHMILYNFYALIDNRGLAPNGWRIATNKDWEILIDSQKSLFNKKVALKFKSKRCWQKPNEFMDNVGSNADFDAYPAGYRTAEGEYKLFGNQSHWWKSANQLYQNDIMIYGESLGLGNDDVKLFTALPQFAKGCGLSIRLIKE